MDFDGFQFIVLDISRDFDGLWLNFVEFNADIKPIT